MNDMRTTIVPKSDQLNSDDLIGRTLTIKVRKVSLTVEADQPVAINFEGDNNKPYKPCKSMRRVLVTCWGPDANVYVGRSMTLYRDPEVQFGGLKTSGIRISHLSDIEKDTTMALTATRANRRPFTVRPLKITQSPQQTRPQTSAPAYDNAAPPFDIPPDDIFPGDLPSTQTDPDEEWADALVQAITASDTVERIQALLNSASHKRELHRMKNEKPAIYKRVLDFASARKADLERDAA
jgi:hypothetical protein